MATANIALKLKDEASKALGDVKKNLNSLEEAIKNVDGAGARMGRLGGVLSAGLTAPISAAFTAISGLVTVTALAADNIDKMSERTGISRRSLQELQYAASQTGVDFRALDGISAAFAGRLDSITKGTGLASEVFKELGLSTVDARGELKTSGQVFEETITAIAGIEDAAQRGQAAIALLGPEGAKLAPLLNAGADGIQNFRDRAHELGIVLPDETISGLVGMGDALDDVKAAMAGLRNDIVREFMPIIREQIVPLITETIIPALREFGERVAGVIRWFNDLNDAQKTTIGAIVAALAASGPLLIGLGQVINAVNGIKNALVLLRPVLLMLSLNPAAALVLAVAGLAALGAKMFFDQRNSAAVAARGLADSIGGGDKESLVSALDAMIEKAGGDTKLEALRSELIQTGDVAVEQAARLAVYINALEEIGNRDSVPDGDEWFIGGASGVIASILGDVTDLERILNAADSEMGSEVGSLWARWNAGIENQDFYELSETIQIGIHALEQNTGLFNRYRGSLAELNEIREQIQEDFAAYSQAPLRNMPAEPYVVEDPGTTTPAETTGVTTAAKVVDAAAPAPGEAARAWIERWQDEIDLGLSTGEDAIEAVLPRFLELNGQLLTSLAPGSEDFNIAKERWDILKTALVGWGHEFKEEVSSSIDSWPYYDFLMGETERQGGWPTFDDVKDEVARLNEVLRVGAIEGWEYFDFLSAEGVRQGGWPATVEEAAEAVDKARHVMNTAKIDGWEYFDFLNAESDRQEGWASADELAAQAVELAETLRVASIDGWEYFDFLSGEGVRQEGWASGDELREQAVELAEAMRVASIDGWEYYDFLTEASEAGAVSDAERERLDAVNALVESFQTGLDDSREFFEVTKNGFEGAEGARQNVLQLNRELLLVENAIREAIAGGYTDTAAFEQLIAERQAIYDARKAEIAVVEEADAAVQSQIESETQLQAAMVLANDILAKRLETQSGLTAEQTSLLTDIDALRAAQEALGEITDENSAAYNLLEEAIVATGEEFKKASFKEALNDVQDAVSNAFSLVGDLMAEFGASDAAVESVNQLGSAVDSAFSAAMSFASGDILGGIMATVRAIAGIFNWLRNLFKSQAQKDAEEAARVWDDFVEGLASSFENSVRSALSNAIKDAVMNGGENYAEAMANFRQSFRDAVYSSVLDGIIEALIQKAIIEGALGPYMELMAEAAASGNWEMVSLLVREVGGMTNQIIRDMEPVIDELLNLKDSFYGTDQIGKPVIDYGPVKDMEDSVTRVINDYTSALEKTESSASEFGEFASRVVSIPLYDASIRFSDSVNNFGQYVNMLVTQGILVHAQSNVTVNNSGIPAYN